MKKVKNLTENKDLINTFKKFKNNNHVFKSTLKKKYFFLSKLQHQLALNNRLFYFGAIFNQIFYKTTTSTKLEFIPLNLKYKQKNNFLLRPIQPLYLKKLIMFINLYFY
jgi:hypothetical protein